MSVDKEGGAETDLHKEVLQSVPMDGENDTWRRPNTSWINELIRRGLPMLSSKLT